MENNDNIPTEADPVLIAPEGTDLSALGDLSDKDRGGIITARGTAEGLIIRLDGRVDPLSLRKALIEFLGSRRDFLAGNEVSLEWIGAKPEEILVTEILGDMSREFGITVKSSRLKESRKHKEGLAAAVEKEVVPTKLTATQRPVSLFGGIEGINVSISGSAERIEDYSEKARKFVEKKSPAKNIPTRTSGGAEAILWDDPDARIYCGTLRSGQKIETEHSLVIVGEVNSGAEVVAGGDIVVLGTLRGVAHAGAYDETGGGRFIFALGLRPTQLRIGTVISRGSPDDDLRAPEIARVEGNIIVVEQYQAKGVLQWRRS